MDLDTVRAKMMAQVNRAANSAMARAFGWSFEIEDLALYALLRHRRRSEHTYLLRVSFEEFPRRAPSYVFVDRQNKEVTDAAWPPGVKHGDPLPGICTPGTRECHEKYHANDAQYAWDAERYTFLDTLLRIHNLMERGLGG
jgi:hypothetical protein